MKRSPNQRNPSAFSHREKKPPPLIPPSITSPGSTRNSAYGLGIGGVGLSRTISGGLGSRSGTDHQHFGPSPSSSTLNVPAAHTGNCYSDDERYQPSLETRASYSRFLATKTDSRQSVFKTKGHTRSNSSSDNAPMEDPSSIPKAPAYEYYGFMLYLTSFVTFGIFLLWSYLPDKVLHNMGITYYPDRYWALAIPVWFFALGLFVFTVFISVIFLNTEPFDSFCTVTDEYANIMQPSDHAQLLNHDAIPELKDVPIGVVNACLYRASGTPWLARRARDDNL